MNIVPAPVEKYTRMVSRNVALTQVVFGIILAVWAIIMLSVLVYAASPLSIVEVHTFDLIFGFLKWIAAFAFGTYLAIAFFLRYRNYP